MNDPKQEREAAATSAKIEIGLSLMAEEDFQVASTSLFDEGIVDVVEWSFDMGWGRKLSPWVSDILTQYSNLGKLLGHGVSYSALDASETPRQAIWLDHLTHELRQRSYRHISEHFGFMGGGNFHIAAPLPVPRTQASIVVGRQRLADLAAVAQVPVGLENLAFAFNLQDVREQGPFLAELLEPVDGFLLLDLHNLYCQACNFEVGIPELMSTYPLERVRELHISGGSWAEHPLQSGNRVRRDTHDDAVPEAIFAVLPEVLKKCSNVEAVILERLGGTLAKSNECVEVFQADFRRLKSTIGHFQATNCN